MGTFLFLLSHLSPFFCVSRLRCEEASPRNKWIFYTRLKQISLLAQLASKIADAGRILDGVPSSSDSSQAADSTTEAAATSGEILPTANAAAQEMNFNGSISGQEAASEMNNGSTNNENNSSNVSRSHVVALAQAEASAELLSSCWEFMLEEDLFAADVLLRPATKALVDALTYAATSHSKHSSSGSSSGMSGSTTEERTEAQATTSHEATSLASPLSDIEASAAAVGCTPRAAAIACLHALVSRAGAYEEGDVIAVTAGASRGGPRSDSGGEGGGSGSFDSNFTLASSDEEGGGHDDDENNEGADQSLTLEESDTESPEASVSPRRSVASDEVAGSSSSSSEFLSPNPSPPLLAATLAASDGSSSDQREDNLQPEEEKDDNASTAAERSGDVDESVLEDLAETGESDPTLNLVRFKKLSGVLEAVKLNKWVTLMDLRRRYVAAALHTSLKAHFLLEGRLQACLDVPPRTVAVAVAVNLAQPLGLGLTPAADIGHLQPNSPFAERVPAAGITAAAAAAAAAVAAKAATVAAAAPGEGIVEGSPGGRGDDSERGGRGGRGRGRGVGGRGQGRGRGRGGRGNGASSSAAAAEEEAPPESKTQDAFERVELHSIVPGSRVIAVGATAASSSSPASPQLPLPPPPTLQPSPRDDTGVAVWSQDALKARIAVAKAVSLQSESGYFMPVTSLQSLSEALQALRDRGLGGATVLVEVPAAGIGCDSSNSHSESGSSSGSESKSYGRDSESTTSVLEGASLADRCALVALLAEMIVVQPQHLDFFRLKPLTAEGENDDNDAGADKEAGADTSIKSNGDSNATRSTSSSSSNSRREGGLWPALVRLFFAFPRSDMLNNGFFKCCEVAVKENHRASLKSLLVDDHSSFLGRVVAPLTASFGASSADAGPPLRFNVPSTVVIAEQAHLLERSDDICLDSDGESGEEEDGEDNSGEGANGEGEAAKAADRDEGSEEAAESSERSNEGDNRNDVDGNETSNETALVENAHPTATAADSAASSSPEVTDEGHVNNAKTEEEETPGPSTASANGPRLLPKLAPSLAKAQAARFAELLRDACSPLPKHALLPTALRRHALWQSEVLPALAALEEQWSEKGLGLHVATAMTMVDSSEEEEEEEEDVEEDGGDGEAVFLSVEDDDIDGDVNDGEVMVVEGVVQDEASGKEPKVVMVEEVEEEESPLVVLAAPSSATAPPLHLANEFVAIVPPVTAGTSSGSSSMAARIWALKHSSRFCGSTVRWRHGPVAKAQQKKAMARRQAAAAVAAASSLTSSRKNGATQDTVIITPLPAPTSEAVENKRNNAGNVAGNDSKPTTPPPALALASASPRTKATNAVAQAVAAAAERASNFSNAPASNAKASKDDDEEDDRRVIHLGDSPPRPENDAQENHGPVAHNKSNTESATTAAVTAPHTPPDLRSVRRASEIRPDDAEAAAAAVAASGRWRMVGSLPRPRRATSVHKEGRRTPCPIKPPKKVPTLRPGPSSIS
jgi:hypothetical protein